MKTVKKYLEERPYIPLWILSSFFLLGYILSLSLWPETIDVNFYDTYYVIATTHFFLIFTLWFGCCGLGYLVLKQGNIRLIFWLTTLHLALSTLMIFPLCFPGLFEEFVTEYPGITDQIDNYNPELNLIRIWGLGLLVLAQLVYFLNIFISVANNFSFRK